MFNVSPHLSFPHPHILIAEYPPLNRQSACFAAIKSGVMTQPYEFHRLHRTGRFVRPRHARRRLLVHARTKNVGDFFLGGRTLGPWMSAFAYGTTYFSAVLFIGYAGKLGWGFGIYTLWIVIGNTFIGTLLAWMVLAGRTRDMTSRLNAITMPEFLSARYGNKPLQVIAALVVFVFLVPYSASVLMGLSYLFEMTLHIPYENALYFLTALTAVYLVMGGYSPWPSAISSAASSNSPASW